jgi:hypothetical protein
MTGVCTEADKCSTGACGKPKKTRTCEKKDAQGTRLAGLLPYLLPNFEDPITL